jgi:hypothetical protein
LERESVLCKKNLEQTRAYQCLYVFYQPIPKLELHESQCGKGSFFLLMIWTMNLNFHGQLEKKSL